jgi:Tol biopolymer transport system component
VIYTAISHNGENDGVFVLSLDSGESRQLMNASSAASYAEGSLWMIRNGRLLAFPFDLRSLATSGDPKALRFAERVDRFSVSSNGILAYRNRDESPPAALAWLDRRGEHQQVIADSAGVTQFSVAPDGRMIASSRSGDIWVSELSRGVTSRFTFDPGEETFPIWSPDGLQIAFLSNQKGRRGLYRKASHSAGDAELLLENPLLRSVNAWSPDGRFIAYTAVDAKRMSTIWLLPVDGDRKPFMIPSNFNLREPTFSPDGRWLAYVSDESGDDEVYIASFPPGEFKRQASVNGGARPKWRSDARELYYVSNDGALMAAPLRLAAPSDVIGVPVILFFAPRGGYEVAADGRFLMSMRQVDESTSPIDVVVNWAEEIGR